MRQPFRHDRRAHRRIVQCTRQRHRQRQIMQWNAVGSTTDDTGEYPLNHQKKEMSFAKTPFLFASTKDGQNRPHSDSDEKNTTD